MNRTIKEATVKRYHYDSHAQLTEHLHDFINAYNYGRRLKTPLFLKTCRNPAGFTPSFGAAGLSAWSHRSELNRHRRAFWLNIPKARAHTVAAVVLRI
jgi:hypothetical protein